MTLGGDDVLVVSGGASGIGLAVVRVALAEGAKVCLLDRAGTADVAPGDAGTLLALECDVTDDRAVRLAIERCVDRFGAITGLVASAGIEVGGPSHSLPMADWRRTLDVNLTGTFTLIQTVLASRSDAEPLSIVCLSSPAAFVGFAGGENAAYSASKGGVSALVRTLAIEYAPSVRVNAVVPGSTETPLMWATVPSDDIDTVRAEVEQAVPMGRLADPAEVAEAILWLVGSRSSYVTGTQLICDGGLLAKAAIAV